VETNSVNLPNELGQQDFDNTEGVEDETTGVSKGNTEDLPTRRKVWRMKEYYVPLVIHPLKKNN
jgi:hypothetical protein